VFKLAHNGNVLLDVSMHSPPNAAFIIEAIKKSTFCDCRINHDAINSFFAKDKHSEPILVVATQLDATLNVTISDDKMLAVGELTLAQGGNVLSLEEAKVILIKARISRGYRQAFLEALLQKQFEMPPGSKVKGLLAKGRLPINGQSTQFIAQVKTLKERLKTPQLLENGRVDMRDFGKLVSVQPGQVLIRQHPAIPGKAGFTVLGDMLPAKSGKSHTLVSGEGTEISPTNPHELLSTIAGVPVDINNGMRVDDIFTIAEVTNKSGHIDFEGSVIVTGNVAPGMKVTAKGDITIFGTVEAGELIATGDITVKQGGIGHQRPDDNSLSCKLISQGDIYITHAQYCYIEANNIVIERQASHCALKAKGVLQIGQNELPQGKLFGGEVLDAATVIAGEIGNESGAKMVINLAASGAEITATTDSCFKELAKTDQQLDSLQAALEKAEKFKDLEKKNLLLTKIAATQQHYCKQAEQLEKRLSDLENNLHGLLNDAKLTVNTVLHSGVEIRIFDKLLKTIRSYPPCHVSLQDNKVELVFKTS
jgi:uncharacterized protein